MGLREAPLFFFAVGLAHYAVLFVTLYQRLPTNEALPKELHPVFLLFVAAPSVFRGFRLSLQSLAWWAYTSPMASAAAAAIRYSAEVDNAFTRALCVALSAVATLTVAALLATTVVRAVVLRNCPNDICIASSPSASRKVLPVMELQESAGGHDHDIEATHAAGATAGN